MSGPTAAEVAAWMLEEFERAGSLSQADAAAGIRARFGPAFLRGAGVRKDVLAAFGQLDPGGRVWVQSARTWRRRNAYDPPFRGTARGE